MNRRTLLLGSCFVALAANARATDLVVDAGGTSQYLTIDEAMVVAAPGDRILVKPGAYPSFQFSRGVSVIGLGTDASQVQVERVDYHPTLPWVGYDSTLSNLTLVGNLPESAIALTGNELGPGTLTVSGVVIQGSVFLRGGPTGFYLHMENSRVIPSAGDGFSNEAMWFGGPNNVLDMVDTIVTGANEDDVLGLPAQDGLRLNGGTFARISNSTITGGSAHPEHSTFHFGGDAINRVNSTGTDIRIDGGSVVTGGNGAGGAGGDGVDVIGNIKVGAATVAAGTGSPSGSNYAGSQPSSLMAGLALGATPAQVGATGNTYYSPGDVVTLSMGADPAFSVILLSLAIDLPVASQRVPLTQILTIASGNTAVVPIPDIPSFDMPGVFVYAQGFSAVAPLHTRLEATNVVAFRVDL